MRYKIGEKIRSNEGWTGRITRVIGRDGKYRQVADNPRALVVKLDGKHEKPWVMVDLDDPNLIGQDVVQ